MLFPAGKSKLHKGVHPNDVLDTVDTGYIRLTVEGNGLDDYYILYSNHNAVGALCEFADGRRLYAAEAVDSIHSFDSEVLAETVMYPEGVITRIKRDYPELFFVSEDTEQFKIADTIFKGTLFAVETGDFLDVLGKLEAEELTGCIRVTRETEEAIQEGAVLFLEKPVAAVFESGNSVRLGDDALREITLFYTQGRVYRLDEKFIEDFLFLKNASRLKSPVEEIIASEKTTDDLRRYMALQALGLERGILVLNAPCNGTFSFEALLKSATARNFDGYLWVRSDDSRGLMVMGEGKVQAAYSVDSSTEVQGMKALRKIYESMESKGTVDFYQLPTPPRISQSFETVDDVDEHLVKKLMGEMGQELIKDVSMAKEFKKRWKNKKKKLGE
ncbi:MAG: hypothetical protein HXS46_15560 [Theionarchaea archaeon]|nr:MAG: hypothetical protein AYK18_05565 [Theionarchaea archaeon DG-70]MBU7012101.1 hypothetical protein [Theionarchaea archaeon]